MKNLCLTLCLILALTLPQLLPAQQPDTNSPGKLLTGALTRVAQIFEAPNNPTSRTFTATLKILKADGLPEEFLGREVILAFQAPDRLRLATKWDGQEIVAGRDDEFPRTAWIKQRIEQVKSEIQDTYVVDKNYVPKADNVDQTTINVRFA